MALTDNTETLRTILNEVNSLPNAGIDTKSDSPATASDIVVGKEAFVNGAKVIGNIPVQEVMPYGEYIEPIDIGWGDDEIVIDLEIGEDKLFRKGSKFYTNVFAGELGDASRADVVAGKTFTSLNGYELKATGTMEQKHRFEANAEITDGELVLTTELDKKYFVDETVQSYIPDEKLGDANPEDVVIGATFTSANGGLKKEGELERHGWFDVFREDMKIDDEGDFCIVKNLDKRYYIEENAGMYFDASLLGNAEPSDVAKGVFFTSENGLNIEGTKEVPSKTETWTLTLENGSTTTKVVWVD